MIVTPDQKREAMKYVAAHPEIKGTYNKGEKFFLYGTVAEIHAMNWFRENDLICLDDRHKIEYDFHVSGLMIDVKHTKYPRPPTDETMGNINLKNRLCTAEYYMMFCLETNREKTQLLEAHMMGFADKRLLQEHGNWYETGDVVPGGNFKTPHPMVCIKFGHLYKPDDWARWFK